MHGARLAARAGCCCLALAVFGSASEAVLDVPYVKQIGAGCGSAAVAMVMQYWVRATHGTNATAAVAERINRALPPPRKGLSGDALRRYFEANGFSAFAFNGELTDLRNHIAKGRPIIVCLGRGERHFVVLTGVEENAVVFNDPARGKFLRESLKAFLREWRATGDWALLAVPQSRQ